MSRDEYFDTDKYQRSSKLFITNLPPNIPEDQLKNDLQPMFEKFGNIKSINVKKHKSGQYSYSFLQFDRIQDAIKAIQEMDQKLVHERPMKVRQDRQGDGCFHCKKTGHFAKQCPYRQSGGRQDRRRSSRERDRYDNDRYRRREKQRSRSRSGHYERQRPQRRHRKSRSRQYSPYEYRRREHRRQRHRRSKSRSHSGSYQDRRYRRRSQFQRDQKRQSREYRRRSRSSSYERRGR